MDQEENKQPVVLTREELYRHDEASEASTQ